MKWNQKLVRFLKKEGFYVAIFVCLCVIAIAAAVNFRTTKNSQNTKSPVVKQETKTGNELTKNTTNDKSIDVQNAVQANNEGSTNDMAGNDLSNEVANNTEANADVNFNNEEANSDLVEGETADSEAVNSDALSEFVKPVEGTIAREFTTETVFNKTIGSYKTNFGIEIQCKLGDPVVAVLSGKVETVDNDNTELGQYVVINHENGLKTIYSNLDANVLVKVGDAVTQGEEIGTVGKTRLNYSDEEYGDHLHFEVKNGNDYVDPEKYIKY